MLNTINTVENDAQASDNEESEVHNPTTVANISDNTMELIASECRKIKVLLCVIVFILFMILLK